MYKVILLGDTEYEQSHVVTQITKVHNQIPATVLKETYYYSINTVSKETYYYSIKRDLLEYEQSQLVIQITTVHSGGFRV
jgi:hypothetical protein